MAAMWAGVVPQQPPTSRAPAAIHDWASVANGSGARSSLRRKPVTASGAPRLGYTPKGKPELWSAGRQSATQPGGRQFTRTASGPSSTQAATASESGSPESRRPPSAHAKLTQAGSTGLARGAQRSHALSPGIHRLDQDEVDAGAHEGARVLCVLARERSVIGYAFGVVAVLERRLGTGHENASPGRGGFVHGRTRDGDSTRRELIAALTESCAGERSALRAEGIGREDLRAGPDVVAVNLTKQRRVPQQSVGRPERECGGGGKSAAPLDLGPCRAIQKNRRAGRKPRREPASG